MFSHKVEIGLRKGEKKMVGYINCTHLHAPEGKCCDAFTEIVYLENSNSVYLFIFMSF